MSEEHIQQLIDSIEYYNTTEHIPYYVLWYIDGEENDSSDQYFAVMATSVKPDKNMIETVRRQSKDEIGNIIYAADYIICGKEEAIDHLENLRD